MLPKVSRSVQMLQLGCSSLVATNDLAVSVMQPVNSHRWLKAVVLWEVLFRGLQ